MQKYKIVVADPAEEDVESLNDYIAYTLNSPRTARRITKGIRKAIASLREMPQRHEFHEDEELKELGIRQHYYKNYKVIYFVNEKTKTILVIRVLHMLVDSKMKLYETFRIKK